MAKGPFFSSPLFLGFEEIERLIDRVGKTAHEGYPPYNIEQIGGTRLRITLAVAGFAREDLQVTLEDNQLVIRGRQTEDESRTYLHRGIATRQFQRAFVIADGIEVAAAQLDSGLLSIDLVRPRPETIVKTIEIETGKGGKSAGQEDVTSLLAVKRERREV